MGVRSDARRSTIDRYGRLCLPFPVRANAMGPESKLYDMAVQMPPENLTYGSYVSREQTTDPRSNRKVDDSIDGGWIGDYESSPLCHRFHRSDDHSVGRSRCNLFAAT